MSENQNLLAQAILNNIKELIEKWKRLNIYASPCPDCPDYGVKEQELLIKRNIILQLKMIKDYVDCDELLEQCKKEFGATVEKYIIEEEDEYRIEKVFNIIGLRKRKSPSF